MWTIKNEVKRKLFHQSSLTIPIGYLLLQKETMLILTGITAFLFIITDILRFRVNFIKNLIYKICGPIIREEESSRFFGSTYVMIGGFFTILFFEKSFAITALLYLTISDSLAAIIGSRFGRIKINNKSLIGFLSFMISGLLIGIYITNLGFRLAFTGAFLTAIIELIVPKKIDDNIVIPVTGGLFLTIFSKLIL